MTDRPTRLPGLLTRPMSWVYAIGAAHQARGFDAGRGVVRLDRPVISVGNLSAGGTGKSPMVHHLVRTLLEHGHSPAIAMRGYKAAPGALGDEGTEHRQLFPGVPIVAQPDRVAALQKLLATGEGRRVDCIVLDDGFQHRRIARDLDLVLIDASRPPDRDALLPHGFLREPISALARADACVLMHTELVDELELQRLDRWVQSATGEAPIAHARHDWAAIDLYEQGQTRAEPASWIEAKRVILVCGIGNPVALERSIRQHGGEPVSSLVLGDHQAITAHRFRALLERIDQFQPDAVLMTRKDWVKLGDLGPRILCPIAVPRLELGFGGSSEPLEAAVLAAMADWAW